MLGDIIADSRATSPGIDEGSTRSREEINGAARCGTSLKPD
jgi:hypothetical protein